jgi:DNA-binding LacI/PurR family transcriptional regulator
VVPARDVPTDGAVAYAADPESPALAWLERRKVPLVYVEMKAPINAAGVIIDDRGGAATAAEFVLGLGHRHIALFTFGLGDPWPASAVSPAEALSAMRSYSARERLRGWSQALDASGITGRVAGQRNSFEDARPAARLMLQARPQPTAVLCYSDVMAHDVVRAADELGLRVPDDLTVVGFDDHPLALRMQPRLTTVRQDVNLKGHEAVRILRNLMAAGRGGEDDRSMTGERRTLPVELIIRDSSGPVRSDAE